MTPRPSLSVRWPLALLLASVLLTGVAAFQAQRAVRFHRDLAERALRDYAGFGAWSYQQHLQQALESAVGEALGAVNHGDDLHTNPGIPDAEELAHYLRWDARCGCHRSRLGPSPAAFYGFTLGADTLGVGLNQFAEPARGWLTDESDFHPRETAGLRYGEPDWAPAADERRWLQRTLERTVRSGTPTRHRFGLVPDEWSGAPRLVAYTLMPTSRGDTIVYATEYRPADLERLFAQVFEGEGLLPKTFTHGRPNHEIMALEVRDAAGRLFFATEPPPDWDLDATHRLPASHGGLIVRARVRPEVGGSLIIGGLPGSRLPYLLGLLALATALSVVAVMQLRREGELARLQAGFVSSVSHELRTPLAQIRLWLETLRLGRFTSEAQRERTLEILDRETRRLSHLVDNVLRFSRHGAPDAAVALPTDVGAEAEEIVDEFAPLAAARGAHVEVEADSDARADLAPGALRQVLLNLLDNAVKYGPADQTVKVRVSRDGGIVRLAVADEGPGIAESERDAVWGAFRRGEAAKTGAVGGSGIGLTIVRQLAERHGGRALVRRAPGGGAEFVVELPASAAPPVTSEPHVEVGAP